MKILRCAVIGYGNIGSAHAKSIASKQVQGMELTALCDIDEIRCKKAAERYPNVHIVTDYHKLLYGSIDAVIIAVPHPMHTDIALDCLNAGVDVLVEKPIDISVSRAKRAVDAAGKTGRLLAVMLNQRTNSIFRRAREIVQNGELGEIKRSVWIITNWYRTQQYYDSGSWRATWKGEGGGVLLNQAPHNLDLWQWIIGMPTSVRAFCDVAHFHRIEVEDDATLVTRYKNGATGLFITSTGEYPGTNRLEISGDRGKLVLEGGILKWWRLQESERDFCFRSGTGLPNIPMEYVEERFEEPGQGHQAILQNFANAILHGEQLIATGQDGLNELTLSNAAYLSEWTGNQLIQLPMNEEQFDALLADHAAHSQTHEQLSRTAPDGTYSERWQTRW